MRKMAYLCLWPILMALKVETTSSVTAIPDAILSVLKSYDEKIDVWSEC